MFSTLHNSKNGQPLTVALHNVVHLTRDARGRTILATVNGLGFSVIESPEQVAAIAKGEKAEGMDKVHKEAAEIRASLATGAHLPTAGGPPKTQPAVSDALKARARDSAARRAEAADGEGDGETKTKRTVPKVVQGEPVQPAA